VGLAPTAPSVPIERSWNRTVPPASTGPSRHPADDHGTGDVVVQMAEQEVDGEGERVAHQQVEGPVGLLRFEPPPCERAAGLDRQEGHVERLDLPVEGAEPDGDAGLALDLVAPAEH